MFRGGTTFGPAHSGVELHGFLSYLVHCAVAKKTYTVFGYKGKQVRDQIHSADVVAAFDAFVSNPRRGEVYNLGGGRENAASVIECIELIPESWEATLSVDLQRHQSRGRPYLLYLRFDENPYSFPRMGYSVQPSRNYRRNDRRGGVASRRVSIIRWTE